MHFISFKKSAISCGTIQYLQKMFIAFFSINNKTWVASFSALKDPANKNSLLFPNLKNIS